jgi:hypothetical protein
MRNAIGILVLPFWFVVWAIMLLMVACIAVGDYLTEEQPRKVPDPKSSASDPKPSASIEHPPLADQTISVG